MASTYSDLKFELIGTGDQSGTWGTTTNDNIGTAIEQAITGFGNPIFTTDANLTISLTNTVALQTARALVLNATSSGSLTATRELVVPTIEKQYIVQNNTTGSQSITVKTSAGTGITVPNGKKMHLYVDGVNVVDAVSHFSSLTLAAALPVLSGGTGVTTSTGSGNNVLSTSPTLVTPILGTPTSVTLTNATGLPLTTGVTGLLPVANGGSGTATPAIVAGTNVTVSGSWPNQTINASSSGDVAGPASATDNAITRFDGTTGKIVQNSLVTVADDGAITAPQVGSIIPFYFANQAAFPSASTYHGALAHSHADGAMFFAHGGVWVRILDNGGPLGTPASGTLTNATGLPLTTGVTGTLPIANGGTGTTSTTFTNLTTNVTGTLPIANGGTGTTSTTFTNLTTNVTGTLPVANGGSGAVTLTGVLKGNGTSAFTAATAGTDYVAPGTATTFTALQTFNGTSSNASHKATNMLEVATVSATAATGTINFDNTTQSVLYYTSNASGNFTLNFRGSSGTTLNTVMSTGESLSATFLVTNGATAYYNSAVTVDGVSVTPKWQGGTAPTSGNASSIDSYTYVIIKTGSAAFTVLAAQTKFA